jgi:shikimate dehydrogenase
MKKFGLIGKTLSHSFSQNYFQKKFEAEGIQDCSYENLEFPDEISLEEFLKTSVHLGLNVTIPYKEVVLNHTTQQSSEVDAIGAANVLKATPRGWAAYNTDAHGFQCLLRPHMRGHHRRALVLGTGGASKAVSYVLKNLGLDHILVSRTPGEGQVTYEQLNENAIRDFNLIVNTTPLGTHPDVNSCPDIPYEYLTENNLLIDLVYNPEETLFMLKGKAKGAMVANGLEMLKAQAEKAWEIWHLDSAR